MKNPGKLRKWMIKKLGGYTYPYPFSETNVRVTYPKTLTLGAVFVADNIYKDYAEEHAKRILCDKLAERLSKSDAVEITKTQSPEGLCYSAKPTVIVPEDRIHAEV